MSKEVVALFAGQGAQAVGMGKDLVEKYPVADALFSKADAVLGFALSEVMFEGPEEELVRTSRCQPALYVHGLACLEILKELVPGLQLTAAAGLSLGEFTAHAAAGTFDFESGLRLVHQRGRYMEDDANAVGGTMAAMVGGTEDSVRSLAAEAGVDVANLNAPGQIVLSGTREGVAAAIAGAKAHGIKIAKELEVAGAYHSRLMQTAQGKLAAVLAEVSIEEPEIPVICNVEARAVSGADDIRGTLERQVTGSVRWSESMELLTGQGKMFFVELGPGGVLAGLMRRIDRNAQVLRVGDVAGLEAAAEVLKG
jgi:[acyl-carrier-protein] S-malonyltransferase